MKKRRKSAKKTKRAKSAASRAGHAVGRAKRRVRRAARKVAKKVKRAARRIARKVARRSRKSSPSGGRKMGRRKKSSKVAKTSSMKKGFPSWVKPTFAMLIGGGLGFVASEILPPAIGPYAPALGIVAARFVGGGGWAKYLTTAGVVTGVTFLARRPSVQVAKASLGSAKRALMARGTSGGPEGQTAAERGAAILNRQGAKS